MCTRGGINLLAFGLPGHQLLPDGADYPGPPSTRPARTAQTTIGFRS